MRPTKSRSRFTRLTKWTAHFCGQPITFSLALGIIVGWALLGPYFGFSDTWQLVINTGTTIVTFLMVFLIQSTQNRDTESIELLDLEELEECDLDDLKQTFIELAKKARRERLQPRASSPEK
jgi:low affinity Fe/Cu permease